MAWTTQQSSRQADGSNASSARKKPRKIEGKKYTRIHARGTHGLIRRNAVTRVESLLFFSPPPSLPSYAANHNISSRVWLIAAISCEPSLLHVFPSPPPIFPCLNKPLDKRNWLKRKILDLEPSQSYYYSQSEWHKIALLSVLNVLSRDTVFRARRRYWIVPESWIFLDKSNGRKSTKEFVSLCDSFKFIYRCSKKKKKFEILLRDKFLIVTSGININ